MDLLATASALLGSGHLPAVLLHRHDHHILIALLSSLIIYWSVANHILILIVCSFFWLATIVTLVLLPQASTPPSSRSKAASCSKSCSACSTSITNQFVFDTYDPEGHDLTTLSHLLSTCLFLEVSSVPKDQFLVSLCSLPYFIWIATWPEISFRCQLEKLYSCRFKNRRCYCWRLRRLRAWAGPSRHWENGSHRRAPSTFSSQPPPPPSTRPNPFPSVVFRCLLNVLWYSNPSQPVYMYCLPLHCGLNHCTVCQFWTYFDVQTYLCPNVFIFKLTFALFLAVCWFVCFLFLVFLTLLFWFFFIFCIHWTKKNFDLVSFKQYQ